MIAQDQIESHRQHGSWRTLHDRALAACKQASEQAGRPIAPVLGGGTRLMLAMAHRISDDIALFINDPQWIGYMTPRLADPQALGGEKAASLTAPRPRG